MAHIQRRHSEHAGQFVGAFSVNPLKESSNNVNHGRETVATVNADLLRELKDIKERLMSTERQLQKEKENDHQAQVRESINIT